MNSKKKKSIAFIIFFAILCSFSIEILLVFSSPNECVKEMQGDIYELYPQNEAIFSGYDIENGTYIPNNDDPQILFANVNKKIRSIRIGFSEPINNEADIQVYYAQKGELFSEEDSRKIISPKGSKEVVLEIQGGESYETIRVDVGGTAFDLQNIEVSNQVTKNLLMPRTINSIRLIIMCIVALLSFYVLNYRGLFEKLYIAINGYKRTTTEYCYLNRKKILFRIVELLGVFLLSIFSEYIITSISIFNKANSQGSFNYYRWLFKLSILLLIYMFIIVRKRVGANPENMFLIISITIGTLFAFTLPVNTLVSWDDEIHYGWALEQSYFGDTKLTRADLSMTGREMPVVFSPLEVEQQRELLNDQYKEGYITKKEKNYTSFYQRIGHLPSAIMLFIGRALGFSFANIFILGRWANVLVYSFVVYFAIKRLKTGKMIMSVIALFPTNIFLASTYSYDFWVSSFIMLGMAYLLSELQQPDEVITPKNAAIMLGSFIIGFGPKAIYFPLLLLLFMIKSDKFKNISSYKKYRLMVILAIIFVFGSFMGPFVIKGPGIGDLRGGSGVNSTEQVKFILSHPIQYGKILLSFLKSYLSLENSKGFIAFLYYLDLNYSGNHLLLIITLFITVFTDKNENDVLTSGGRTKMIMFSVCLVIVALLSTALYVAFTPVGLDTINGVQPRYLLPLLFPILSIAGSSKIYNNTNKTVYNSIFFAISSYALIQTIWDVCISKYIY